MSSSGDESDISESEINDYKEKPYGQLRAGGLKVKVNGALRCPFCIGKKKREYKYKELYQHALGVAKGSANRGAKQKANHLALAHYLENELADEAGQVQPAIALRPVNPTTEQDDLFVWPWMGITVRVVTERRERYDMLRSSYWMRKYVIYKPSDVCTFWIEEDQAVWAILRFSRHWSGFMNSTEFEKSFESENRGRRAWIAWQTYPEACTYGWCARSDDYGSVGPIGEYLRREGRLRTVSDVEKEERESSKIVVARLANKIDETNQDLVNLQSKFTEKAMSLARMLEEKDKLHLAFVEESKKMQQLAKENVRRILAEQENLTAQLEDKRKKLYLWSKELNKREAVTECERQKLDEEKKKNDIRNTSLELASIEQKKVDENVLRLIEEQKLEKEEALNRILQLEKQLDAKQKLDMEIEELKGRIEVMKHLGDQDDAEVKSKLKKLQDELQEKNDDLAGMEDLNSALTAKERQSNDELQETRKELIAGLSDLLGARTKIGLKRMGEIKMQPFLNTCKQKFPRGEAEQEATQLCSLWQENLKNAAWHPFKVISVGGSPQEVIDEKDEELQNLKQEWGEEIYAAVISAVKERNEYNPSGGYVVSELWHTKQDRKATLKEVIAYILEIIKKGKKKT